MPEKPTPKSRIKNGSPAGEAAHAAIEDSRSSSEEGKSRSEPPKTQKAKPKTTSATSGIKVSKVIEDLEAKQKSMEDKYIRLRAEFDNHIKRTNKEKAELLEFAGSHIIRAVLPILDDLQRTIEHAQSAQPQKDDPLVEGVKMIIGKFEKVLEREGVEVIHAVGEIFDPELHEALMTRNSEDHPEGIVVEEYESGYICNGKVLRHAKVIVSG
ncbi:nucleotide exchange factor GrpE [Candidatus Neomarinimicrobiota bacterium]